MSCQEERKKGIVLLYISRRVMAAHGGGALPAQGLMEKETLTPNYRPPEHHAGADMSCQLTLFSFVFNTLPRACMLKQQHGC